MIGRVPASVPGRANEEGFTLVELIMCVAMSGIIAGGLMAVLLVTFRTTTGLAAKAPVFGKQNSDVIVNQVVVNNDIQKLTRVFSGDAANVITPAGAVAPGAIGCALPANDPSLGSDTSLVKFSYRDNADSLHGISYVYSADSLRRQAELVRYDCTSGPATAQVLVTGLDSELNPPTFSSLCASGGTVSPGNCATPVGYRLTVTTLIGRKYTIDGSPRVSSGSLTPLGAPTPSVNDPLPDGVTMVDADHDGFIETVLVKYLSDPAIACLSMTAFQSTLPPSGATLGPPTKPGGNSIALPYLLPTGTADTSASGFTVSFTPPVGCPLNPFSTLAPTDKANPVLLDLQPAAGSSPDGKPDPGDSFSLTFSEPLDPAVVPSTVRLVEQNASGHDRLFLVAVGGTGNDLTPVQGVDLGTNGTYLPAGASGSYLANVTTDNAAAPRVLTVTIPAGAPCDTGVCSSFTPNAGSMFTFVPGSGLRDMAADPNTAVAKTTSPVPVGLFRMY